MTRRCRNLRLWPPTSASSAAPAGRRSAHPVRAQTLHSPEPPATHEQYHAPHTRPCDCRCWSRTCEKQSCCRPTWHYLCFRVVGKMVQLLCKRVSLQCLIWRLLSSCCSPAESTVSDPAVAAAPGHEYPDHSARMRQAGTCRRRRQRARRAKPTTAPPARSNPSRAHRPG